MRFLIQIFALLMLIYFVRAILRALLPSIFSQATFRNAGNPAQPRSRAVKQGKMEKDPACGTYVDVTTSLHEAFGCSATFSSNGTRDASFQCPSCC